MKSVSLTETVSFRALKIYPREFSGYLSALKRQSLEIFDFWFFSKINCPWALKYFRIPFRIRGDIQPQNLSPHFAT
jgi:hypothetical protein